MATPRLGLVVEDKPTELSCMLKLLHTLQWNLSIADTLGTAEHVLISELSVLKYLQYLNKYF